MDVATRSHFVLVLAILKPLTLSSLQVVLAKKAALRAPTARRHEKRPCFELPLLGECRSSKRQRLHLGKSLAPWPHLWLPPELSFLRVPASFWLVCETCQGWYEEDESAESDALVQ